MWGGERGASAGGWGDGGLGGAAVACGRAAVERHGEPGLREGRSAGPAASATGQGLLISCPSILHLPGPPRHRHLPCFPDTSHGFRGFYAYPPATSSSDGPPVGPRPPSPFTANSPLCPKARHPP